MIWVRKFAQNGSDGCTTKRIHVDSDNDMVIDKPDEDMHEPMKHHEEILQLRGKTQQSFGKNWALKGGNEDGVNRVLDKVTIKFYERVFFLAY